MSRKDDEIAARTAIDPAIAATRMDEDETAEPDRQEDVPLEAVMDVEEWLAEEAGYGYGV